MTAKDVRVRSAPTASKQTPQTSECKLISMTCSFLDCEISNYGESNVELIPYVRRIEACFDCSQDVFSEWPSKELTVPMIESSSEDSYEY